MRPEKFQPNAGKSRESRLCTNVSSAAEAAGGGGVAALTAYEQSLHTTLWGCEEDRYGLGSCLRVDLRINGVEPTSS